jgi:hypothetical protein
MTDITKEKMTKILSIFSICVSLILAILLWFSGKRIEGLKQTEQLYIVAQDTIKQVTNRDKTHTATILVLQSENDHLFTNLKSDDATIIELQKLIKNYEKKTGDLNTAILVVTETSLHIRDSLKSVIVGYSHLPNHPDINYPIYKRTFEDSWFKGDILMGIDTLNMTFMSRNKYSILIGEKKISLFKKQLFADVTNDNPATEVKTMRVYQETPIKTDIMKPTIIGGIIGIITGYLLFK